LATNTINMRSNYSDFVNTLYLHIVKTFYAKGKVLLCGEYAVMAGIEALALPVMDGQWLSVWEVVTKGNSKIVWQSKNPDGSVWLDCRMDTDIMHLAESTNYEIGNTLLHILREVKLQKPNFFDHKTIRVETNCEFSRNYGLGTSSTLISTISDWTGVNAFDLQAAVFGGSGYDVAVCKTGKPVVYWIENEEPNWEPWHLEPNLTEHWFLAFPGTKMNSRNALGSVKEKLNALKNDTLMLHQLSACIQAIKNPRSIPLLEAMLEMWQALLSQYLEIPKAYDDLAIKPVQGGLCKWLGAWGGDVLLVNEKILAEYQSTFENMDVVKWNEYVLSK